MPRSTSDAVGSNARCGSAVLISNERSTTSVAVGADDAVMAPDAATAATTSATAARAALAPQRVRKRFMAASGESGSGLRAYSFTCKSGSGFGRSAGRAGGPPPACSQQATVLSPSISSVTGSSVEQRSNAYGHRGWKRQAAGGGAGSGTSPGSASGRKPLPSGWGTAPISASV